MHARTSTQTYFGIMAITLSILSSSIAGAQPNPSQVTWTQGSNAPAPFARAGSGVLGNYFYCFGGDATNPAQAYNLTTHQWEASTPPPRGFLGFSSVATDDAIYLICRFDTSAGSEVQKFEPIAGGPTGTWTQMAPYPATTFQVAAAWDQGNYIYAAGGINGVLQAHRYDIANDQWSPLADLPQYRNAAGGAFVAGKFYLVGGWPINAPTLEYNPASNSWTQKGYMPVWVPLTTWNTTSNGGLVYVIGGGGYTGNPPAPATSLVQVYDPSLNRWEMETLLPAAQGQNSARFVPPNKIVSAGGGSASAPSSVTYFGAPFPTTSPLPGVTARLTATGSTSFSARGGKVKYSIQCLNGGASPVTVDVWIMVTGPDGSQTGPYLTSLNRVLAPGGVYSVNGTVTVPRQWAPGTYFMDGYVGEYNPPSSTLYSADHFSFEKLPGNAPFSPDEPEIGGAGRLFSVVPNPFGSTTEITFAIPTSMNVALRVYNAAGQFVTELANGPMNAGNHTVTFNSRDLPSGVYYATLMVDGQVSTRSVVLRR